MLLKRLLQLTFRILRRLRALTPDLMATETAPPAVSSEHQEPPATEASQPEAAMQRKIADHEEPPREEAPTKSSPSIPVATRGDGKRESTRSRNVYRLGLWVCQPPGGAPRSLGRGTWPTRWHESTPPPGRGEGRSAQGGFAHFTPAAGYLDVKDIRDKLTPQVSPFLESNNAGAGFGASGRVVGWCGVVLGAGLRCLSCHGGSAELGVCLRMHASSSINRTVPSSLLTDMRTHLPPTHSLPLSRRQGSGADRHHAV